MKIELPWGGGAMSLEVPDTWNVIFPERRNHSVDTTTGELELVRNSLKNPVGSKNLSGMKLKGRKIVIVVDDNTRPTPAWKYFHLILDEIVSAGGDLGNVLVIPALGIHTPMTEDEMKEKIGGVNLPRVRWKNHDAFDAGGNHYFGTTSRNTPVFFNRELKDADLVILLGLIEPHNWAGFGGGMKCLLPGVASVETISRHHEIISEPPYLFNRVGMPPDENSFRQDLEEAGRLIDCDIFCLNVVIDHNRTILASFAGDPVESHRKGVEYYRNGMGLRLERPVDGVIVNSYPMDINFKQGMKCVGNSLPALVPGGTVMAFIRAERGMDDIARKKASSIPLRVLKSILRLMGPARVWEFVDIVRRDLGIEEKLFVYYAMNLMRQYDLFIHVPTLCREELKELGFFVACEKPADVIHRGLRNIGKTATVAVFPEGGFTFPIVKAR